MTSAFRQQRTATVEHGPQSDSLGVTLETTTSGAFKERRSDDSVATLSRQLNDACTAAVTSHQIAALLEAEGLNDRLVAERFGRAGVFSLAEELYRSVPLRRTEESAAPPDDELLDPAGGTTFAKLIRGPIYLAPLAFFAAVGSILHSSHLLVAGLVALVAAWSWNQGFGALVFRLTGRLDFGGAHRMARRSLLLGVIVISLVAGGVSILLYGLDPAPLLFAAGQSAYLLGTATLIMFGRDKLLIAMLAPGLTVVLASLFTDAITHEAVAIATIATPAFIYLAALGSTYNPRRVPFPKMTPHDRKIAMTQAVLGLMWAAIIGVSALAVIGTDSALLTISVAASGMVLTMGVAEWRLSAMRTATRRAMIRISDMTRFARFARREALKSVAVVAVSVVVASSGVGALAYWFDALTAEGVVLMVGFAFLSLAFFAGLILVATSRIALSIVGSIVFLVEVGSLLAFADLSPIVASGMYALGCLVLAVTFVTVAVRSVQNPVVHR